MWLTKAFTRFPFTIPENCRHLVSYMPRKPKTKHPIRDLRKIIGKSQREFGLLIGISPSAMKRIENNDLAVSRLVTRKIVYATAIDPRCLNGKLRSLRNVRGEQYTKDFYEAWKDHYSWQDEDAVKVAAGWLSGPMEILLRASVVGSKKRMWTLFAEIAETLDRCRVDFDLQRPIDVILSKKRSPFLAANRPLKWEDLIKPPEWEASFTATRKPRPSSRRRRQGLDSNTFRRPSVSQARGSARR
jgi:transcriptional regulator with XRE-family HTH domain